MILGGLLAKAVVGSEIARNGLVGTIKGIGDILAGTREGLITVANDVKKIFSKDSEPEQKSSNKYEERAKKKGEGKVGQ